MSNTGQSSIDSIDILVVDPSERSSRSDRTWLRDRVTTLFGDAVDPDQRDDRFESWPPEDLFAAVALAGQPAGRKSGTAQATALGYLGGGVDRGRLQLDALVARSVAERGEGPMLLAAMYRALTPFVERSGADAIELWGKPAEAWHRSLADRDGFTELRALHQLRCPLPVEHPAVDTRSFVPGEDEELLLRVNNRAFIDHPDQGAMTLQDLEEAEQQPWFNAEGIRLLEDSANPSAMAGFCWTKIHEPLEPGQPRLGEIYAIGVDPDHHGRGLGKPMTAAGLHWLADQGLSVGMLYVAADNEPALRTYYKLGFEQHRTDRAWRKRLR